MNLRRRLLGLNYLVTLDRAHAADGLGLLLVRSFVGGLLGFVLDGITGVWGFLTGVFGR